MAPQCEHQEPLAGLVPSLPRRMTPRWWWFTIACQQLQQAITLRAAGLRPPLYCRSCRMAATRAGGCRWGRAEADLSAHAVECTEGQRIHTMNGRCLEVQPIRKCVKAPGHHIVLQDRLQRRRNQLETSAVAAALLIRIFTMQAFWLCSS